ncbi:MAG: hypothetical protein PVG39_02750 [Desulfobacteraceae bacterium]|jgi:hypothetical protein
MPDFAVTTAFRGTDKISPVFNRMSASADKFGRHGSSAMNRVASAGSKVTSILKGLVPIVSIAAIGRLAQKGIELASDLTEVQNVVDTTFVQGAKDINKWSNTALKAFGLSELQAKQFAGTIGAMAKGAGVAEKDLYGMSTGLAELAGDFASFYNLPIEEAFNKIRAGLSGETEPLKQIGKDMSVAGLEAFRLAQGMKKAVKDMSMAEKYQLRFAYLMSQSKDQMGDFNKTLATSYANQKRVLAVKFDQFLARVMTKFLPRLTSLFEKMNNAIDKLDAEKIATWLDRLVSLIPYVVKGFLAYKGAIVAIKAVNIGKNLWLTVSAMWELRKFLPQAIKMTKAWTAAQKALNFVMKMNPIGLVIAAVMALGYAVYDLYTNWDKYVLGFQIGMQEWIIKWKTLKTLVLDVLSTLGKVDRKAFERSKLELQIAYLEGEILKKKAKNLDTEKSINQEELNQKDKTINQLMKKGINAEKKGALQVERAKMIKKAAMQPITGTQPLSELQIAAMNRQTQREYQNRYFRAPNETDVQSRNINFNGQLNIAGAPEGSTISSSTKGAKPINMQLVGAN